MWLAFDFGSTILLEIRIISGIAWVAWIAFATIIDIDKINLWVWTFYKCFVLFNWHSSSCELCSSYEHQHLVQVIPFFSTINCVLAKRDFVDSFWVNIVWLTCSVWLINHWLHNSTSCIDKPVMSEKKIQIKYGREKTICSAIVANVITF